MTGSTWVNQYSARRWTPAVEDYSKFVRENPRVGRAWHNLGWALHHSRRHDEARDAFERQLELGHKEGIATYNIACTYAMEENTSAAVQWLERATELGSANFHRMRNDDDLDSLRDDSAFEALMEQARREAVRDGHIGITDRIRGWVNFDN